MYGANEINNHTLDFHHVIDLPFPLFHDYLNYQVKTKRKDAEYQKRKLNETNLRRN